MTYEYEGTWSGTKLELSPNQVAGPRANDLFVQVTGGVHNTTAYLSIKGRDEILRFIYAAAVEGGIIEEGEALTIDPNKRELPEDGTYLIQTGTRREIGFVENGKVYMPTRSNGWLNNTFEDVTDTYVDKSHASNWMLEPIRKVN